MNPASVMLFAGVQSDLVRREVSDGWIACCTLRRGKLPLFESLAVHRLVCNFRVRGETLVA